MDTVHGNRFLRYSKGSFLGPLIFSIFLCGPFYSLDGVTVATQTDCNTLCSANKTRALLTKEIEHFSEVLFQCFDFNCMKVNGNKSHVLFLGNNIVSGNIYNNTITFGNKNEPLTRYSFVLKSLLYRSYKQPLKRQVKNSVYLQKFLYTWAQVKVKQS